MRTKPRGSMCRRSDSGTHRVWLITGLVLINALVITKGRRLRKSERTFAFNICCSIQKGGEADDKGHLCHQRLPTSVLSTTRYPETVMRDIIRTLESNTYLAFNFVKLFVKLCAERAPKRPLGSA
jgi:hypothetical protein